MLPAGFFSDAGCKPKDVSPVENSPQPGDWNLYEIGAQDKVVQRILRHSKPHVTRERYIKVFDRILLNAVGKVQGRIEELRQAKEDRRQLELRFGDDGIVESHADDGFEPSSPVKPPLSHQSIAGSVVSC